ncbi:MAG: hypothetical protein NT141_01655 [candidate division WWE3 bacterium]|nr:hypothetical protein [candidate division WWE3 bacterium]
MSIAKNGPELASNVGTFVSQTFPGVFKPAAAVPAPAAPTVSLEFDMSATVPVGTVQVNMRSTGTGPLTVTLDYGDGSKEVRSVVSGSMSLSHHYSTAGTFNVSAYVVDSAKNAGIANLAVTIAAAVAAEKPAPAPTPASAVTAVAAGPYSLSYSTWTNEMVDNGVFSGQYDMVVYTDTAGLKWYIINRPDKRQDPSCTWSTDFQSTKSGSVTVLAPNCGLIRFSGTGVFTLTLRGDTAGYEAHRKSYTAKDSPGLVAWVGGGGPGLVKMTVLYASDKVQGVDTDLSIGNHGVGIHCTPTKDNGICNEPPVILRFDLNNSSFVDVEIGVVGWSAQDKDWVQPKYLDFAGKG